MNFVLDAEQLPSLNHYLKDRKWIGPDETVETASKPGEGNMNYTLRIRTNFRSFIIKQSRDYVEKYPQIPAPRERAIIEGRFYELIQRIPQLKHVTPEINNIDEENSIIMLEDLGESNDFTFLYQAEQQIDSQDLDDISAFISLLHQSFSSGQVSIDLSNRAMRALNAEHIFQYPFMEDNGFDLDQVIPGLQEIAMPYKTDSALKETIATLSKYYTEDGPTLLHGDYYPGSWLKTLEGVRIIDPEFCFFGRAEFDLSVCVAHFMMGEQDKTVVTRLLSHYEGPEDFDEGLMWQLTGVEIMRRLIGLAQLPLTLSLEKRVILLQQARGFIMQQN
ncbi:MAG: phosphotransferase [Bacteroidota bacterium]